jgi:hypothetical protein
MAAIGLVIIVAAVKRARIDRFKLCDDINYN